MKAVSSLIRQYGRLAAGDRRRQLGARGAGSELWMPARSWTAAGLERMAIGRRAAGAWWAIGGGQRRQERGTASPPARAPASPPRVGPPAPRKTKPCKRLLPHLFLKSGYFRHFRRVFV